MSIMRGTGVRRARLRGIPCVCGIWSLVVITGCKDLTGSQQLPSGTQNPAFYETASGALGMRTAAIYALAQALPQFITDAGLLTDELESNQTGASLAVLRVSTLPDVGSIDERILPEPSYGAAGTLADQDYIALQRMRGLTNQALGALATFDTGTTQQGDPRVMRGELYALEGYTELLLADFFCSGVPLSVLDFQKDFTYHASLTTDATIQDAIDKEDSALALSDTSTAILNLARVLKGRALLDRGKYDSAAKTVAAVPDGFRDSIAIMMVNRNQVSSQNIVNQIAIVSDREGGTGLPFLSSGDPRIDDTVVAPAGTYNGESLALTFPRKYSPALDPGGYASFTIADWIEARLIQAEAALHDHPNDATWLTILNTLRATAPIPGTTQPAMPQQLPMLTDPGSSPGEVARIALLFQERAYWLYMTGHRQGDLRRLIRQYGRPQNLVYPTGSYLAPGAGQYGSDVTAPIAAAEYANPLFHGCLNRAP